MDKAEVGAGTEGVVTLQVVAYIRSTGLCISPHSSK
jgi:hypothetical protein